MRHGVMVITVTGPPRFHTVWAQTSERGRQSVSLRTRFAGGRHSCSNFTDADLVSRILCGPTLHCFRALCPAAAATTCREAGAGSCLAGFQSNALTWGQEDLQGGEIRFHPWSLHVERVHASCLASCLGPRAPKTVPKRAKPSSRTRL